MTVYTKFFTHTISVLLFFALFTSCNGSAPIRNATAIDTLYPLTVLSKKVKETSGLFVLNDRVWTFNDSGDKARLYQISMVTGKVQRKLHVEKAENKDWESVTLSDGKLYIGDTGNNKGHRESVTVYELAVSDMEDVEKKECEPLRSMKFRYPLKHGRPDCEAMVVRNGRLYFFTKERPHGNSKIFSMSLEQPESQVRFEGQFRTQALITSAYMNGDELILLGYKDGTKHRPILWSYPWTGDLPAEQQGQAYYFSENIQSEGITAFGTDAYIISSEGTQHSLPRLWSFTLKQPTPK